MADIDGDLLRQVAPNQSGTRAQSNAHHIGRRSGAGTDTR